MYVKRESVDQLLESTSKKFNDKNVLRFVDSGYMEVFQMLLNKIAEEHKYEEGEPLSKLDASRIQRAVQYTIAEMENIMGEQPLSLQEIMQALAEDMAIDDGVMDFESLTKEGKDYFIGEAIKRLDSLEEKDRKQEVSEYNREGKLSRKERANYDPFSAMMIVNDHMYAMVMKTLGCPDVPEFFDVATKNVMANSAFKAEWSIRERDYRNTLVDVSFKKQRGINAGKMVKSLRPKEDLITKKEATPLDVAQYAGEYFALKKRQEGHGDVWRYFHKKENQKRTQLLEEMKARLESIIGENGSLDDENMTPIKISQIYGKEVFPKKIDKMFSDSIVERNKMSEDAFGYDPIAVEGAKKPEEPYFDGNVREPMKLDESLFKEYANLDVAQPSESKIQEKEIDIDDLLQHHPMAHLD